MCSADELSRRVQNQQIVFQVAMETSMFFGEDYDENITRDALSIFQRNLNACSRDSQSPVCNFWLRRAQSTWGNYNGGLDEIARMVLKNGFRSGAQALPSIQSETTCFLSESGCVSPLFDELALELSADHGKTVTARDDAFIFNDVDAVAPYLITAAGSFFEITSYIADDKNVDDLPLMLPADSRGGVEIVARCPSQDIDTPAQIYEGIILATPPVGEATFLGVRLECSQP